MCQIVNKSDDFNLRSELIPCMMCEFMYLLKQNFSLHTIAGFVSTFIMYISNIYFNLIYYFYPEYIYKKLGSDYTLL